MLFWRPTLPLNDRTLFLRRDLTLEPTGIRILTGPGKIVFFSHRSLQYISSSAKWHAGLSKRITESDPDSNG